MSDYRKYGYKVSNEFVGVMPEAMDVLGCVGTVDETNIDTSILTNKGKLIDVNLISPDFYNFIDKIDYTIVSTPEEIGTGNGKKLLAEDLTVSNSVEIKDDVVLDLNGRTIKCAEGSANATILLRMGGKLTINGEGVVDGGQGGENNAVLMYSQSELTINGGTYTVGPDANGNGNACIMLLGLDIKLTITGGEFKSEKPDNGKYFVVNSQDATKDSHTIVITGGKFWDFDPSNSTLETPAKNYVPDGYKVTKETVMDGETEHTVYTVVKA